MSSILIRSFVALWPTGLLLAGAVVVFHRAKSVAAVLQLIGSGSLTLVALTHIAESLRLFSGMGWGQEHSLGHYIDLSSAVAGITLFPLGYLLDALARRSAPGEAHSGVSLGDTSQ